MWTEPCEVEMLQGSARFSADVDRHGTVRTAWTPFLLTTENMRNNNSSTRRSERLMVL